MFCVKCGQYKTEIINSRQSRKAPSVWRRRRCKNCGHIFTTYEKIAIDQLKVKGDKALTSFSHSKLLISIASCFEHLPKKRSENAEALCETIEVKLLKKGDTTSRKAISELSYDVLKRFDRLASVQYAAKHAETLSKHLVNRF